MKYQQVSKFMEENHDKKLDWSEIFKLYHRDLESAVIACYLLDIDDEYILSVYSQIPKTEDETIYIIDEYSHIPSLLEKLLPMNVFSAFILLTNYLGLIELSKKIVSEQKKLDNYLLEVKKTNMFDNEIIFFSTNIDLKQDKLAEFISNKIKSLDLVFREGAFKDFFYHFELSDFCQLSEENVLGMNALIEEHWQDIVYPSIINFNAKIMDSSIEIQINVNDIKKVILGLKEHDYSSILKKFVREIKSEFADDIAENSVSFLLSQVWGLGVSEAAIKVVKIFLKSIDDCSKELTVNKIDTDFKEFKSSNSDSVKDWFIGDLNTKFSKSFENISGSSEIEILPDSFFKKQYSDFINSYYLIYYQKSTNTEYKPDDTTLFLKVYDLVINNVSMNIGYAD